MSGRKLAVFDVDGTIATQGVFPESIVKGIQHLQKLGYVTTISTGRGFLVAKELFGKHFNDLISPEALVILEHGTKIASTKGKTVFIEAFSETETDHIVDFLRANLGLFESGWFNPVDTSRKQQVWCIEEPYLAKTVERRYYANVVQFPAGELRDWLKPEVLSNVTFHFKEHVRVHNLKLALGHTDINLIFQDGNVEFVKSNTNKGLAILYLMKELGVDYPDVLVAGNAMNDVEMLDLSVGRRVLVGPKSERDVVKAYLSMAEEVVEVSSPEHLGVFLSKL